MSYLNLIGLPAGVSTMTRRRPDSGSSAGMRKSEDFPAAERTASALLSFEDFFRATGGLRFWLWLSPAGERLPGQEKRQSAWRRRRAVLELHARESALLDLDRRPRPAGQEISEQLSQVRHVADEERAGELSPLDLLQDFLRIRPRRERFGLNRILPGVDCLRDRLGRLPG